MHLNARISPGEFLDKLTILEIKSERIEDPEKRRNVLHELESLRADWAAAAPPPVEIAPLLARLKTLNERLWEIEDRIRLKESRREFDGDFIQLARSVYTTNDERSAVKRALNLALGSDLIEEKSYAAGGPAEAREGS